MVRIHLQLLPAGALVVVEPRERRRVDIISSALQALQRLGNGNFLPFDIGSFGLLGLGALANGVRHMVMRARLGQVTQAGLGRLVERRERPLQAAALHRRLGQAQPALAPDDAGQLFDQMVLDRPLRRVLGEERVEQGGILALVLPRQHRVAREHAVLESVEAGGLIAAEPRGQISSNISSARISASKAACHKRT